MKGSTVKWEDGLMKDLQDPKFAQGYVEACLEVGTLRRLLSGVGLELAVRPSKIAKRRSKSASV